MTLTEKCGQMHKNLPWPRFCHLAPGHNEDHETVYGLEFVHWRKEEK